MENTIDKKKNLETELSMISPDRATEQSNLKSNTKNSNDDSLNISNNDNNTNSSNSYIHLVDENTLDLNGNNNNIRNSNNIPNINNGLRPMNVSRISRSLQLIVFVPIVSGKILLPVFFMQNYIIYYLDNEIDQNYCKYSVWILTSLIFLCYFLSVFTPSTQTDVNKYFDHRRNNIYSAKADNPGNELQNLSIYEWTDCLFCNSKKFIRSSHCRTCNRCILLRDHHCPYIANCVGFKNIQYFFNFLFWGDLGMIFYVISCVKYYFLSNVNIIIMPLYLKIVFYVDFFFTSFFIINIMGIMCKLFVNVYNNRTQLENMRGPIIEYFCPIFPKCSRDFSRYNIKPEANLYNIGFLANLYYIIGPTPFHFIFPLPKYKNYTIDENCPIFKKIKAPDRLELFKYMVSKDPNKINILNEDESSPENYVKMCHKYYDGKIFE